MTSTIAQSEEAEVSQPESEESIQDTPSSEVVGNGARQLETETLSIEERLIEKIAEFEGKVEALQSLKANLYEAIEQLDREQRESIMKLEVTDQVKDD